MKCSAAAAHRHGLEFRYQPVRNINVTDDDVVETFARLMENLPGPILFYCCSGTRCTILWTQAAAGGLRVDEILAVAHNAGYDLDFLRDTLADRCDLLAATPAQASAQIPAASSLMM